MIEINPENKGKFTKYCQSKGHDSVSQECIEEGLASNSAKIRARANFANNAQHFKH